MRATLNLVAITVFLAAVHCEASAGMVLSGPADFSGTETTITFGDGTFAFVGDVYTVSGVSFDDSTTTSEFFLANRSDFFDNYSPASLQGALNTRTAFGSIDIDFGALEVSRIAMLASADDATPASPSPATFRLTVFDTLGQLIESIDVQQPAIQQGVFLGYESDVLIGSARLAKISGDHSTIWFIDDVRFENALSAVPEPGSMVLFGIGACMMAALRRRRVPVDHGVE